MKLQRVIAPDPPSCRGCRAEEDLELCKQLMARDELNNRRCVDGEKLYIFTEVEMKDTDKSSSM